MGSRSKSNAAKPRKKVLADEKALSYAIQLHIEDQNKPRKERRNSRTLCHLAEQEMEI